MTTTTHQRPAPRRYPASISEVEALASALEAASCDVRTIAEKLFNAHAAVAAACDGDTTRHCTPGLLHLDPTDIAERVRRVTSDVLAAHDPMAARVTGQFLDQLAADAVLALRDASSDFIPATLRPRFSDALKAIQAAAKAGVTSDTDAASIVEGGHDKQLSAFRALPPAVRVLDEVAGLRDRLTMEVGVGPARYPSAAYLPLGCTLAQLKDFNGYADVVERRSAVDPVGLGVYARDHVVHRTGGRWLALVLAGYRLTLNTGPEADAVLAAAEAAEAGR